MATVMGARGDRLGYCGVSLAELKICQSAKENPTVAKYASVGFRLFSRTFQCDGADRTIFGRDIDTFFRMSLMR